MKVTMIPLLFAIFASVAGAKIELAFENPNDFRDFSLNGRSPTHTAGAFESEFEYFAETRLSRYLPEGHALSLTIKDVDMAGDIQPWRNSAYADIRYVQSIYPPSMRFDYTLTDAEGNEVASGEASVRDLNFDFGFNPMMRSDPFHYEFAMIADWMRSEIKSAGSQAAS